jgi:hypothetical protein
MKIARMMLKTTGSMRHYTAELVSRHYEDHLRPLYGSDSDTNILPNPPALLKPEWLEEEDELLLLLLSSYYPSSRSETKLPWGKSTQLMIERAAAANLSERLYTMESISKHYYRYLRPRYQLEVGESASTWAEAPPFNEGPPFNQESLFNMELASPSGEGRAATLDFLEADGWYVGPEGGPSPAE